MECMCEDDLDQVVKLEEQVLHGRWKRKDFLYEMNENEFAQTYVLRKENQVIGFIDYWITFDLCQLASIAVDPLYQKHGYGHELMNFMLKDASIKGCEFVELEVRVSNQQAIRFYENYGFQMINRRIAYYPDNDEDAFILMKALEVYENGTN